MLGKAAVVVVGDGAVVETVSGTVVSGVVVSEPSAFTSDVGTRTHATRTVRAMRMGDFIVRERLTVI
jgi:putative effector of murein hydrolase